MVAGLNRPIGEDFKVVWFSGEPGMKPQWVSRGLWGVQGANLKALTFLKNEMRIYMSFYTYMVQ